ncbi:MAG TPA: PDZ domain-containing protein [Gammaproteobacteria bacterium]
MRAIGLFLATSLASTLMGVSQGECAPAAANIRPIPLVVTDAPARPGVKTGHVSSMPNGYGDEPGDRSASSTGRRSHTEAAPSEGGSGQSPVHNRVSAYSAVLDTLGSAHGSSATGGGEAQGLGLALRPLTDAERRAFAVEAGGIIVTSVTPGVGMRAGFHAGDVVLMLDGVDVTSTDQFYKLTRELPRDRPVPVLVRRPGSNLFLPLGAPAHR